MDRKKNTSRCLTLSAMHKANVMNLHYMHSIQCAESVFNTTHTLAHVRSPTSSLCVNSRYAVHFNRCWGSSTNGVLSSLLEFSSGPSAHIQMVALNDFILVFYSNLRSRWNLLKLNKLLKSADPDHRQTRTLQEQENITKYLYKFAYAMWCS